MEAIASSRADVVIFSIGSSGQDIQQQCPNFAKEISLTTPVDVFNFDSAFENDDRLGLDKKLSQDNLGVYRFKGKIFVNELFTNSKGKYL